MFKLTVTLSDDLREFLDERREAHGLAGDDELVEFLVRSEKLRLEHDRFDNLISQGLASGESTPMTADDWRNLRERVESKKTGMKSVS